MKLERLQEAKRLLDTGDRLRSIIPKYKEAIKDSRCDKHDLCFVASGEHFRIFKAQVSLSGYLGYYGNSGCSSLTSIDDALAQTLLVVALNRHIGTILNEMAAIAVEKAGELKEAIQQELRAAQELVESLSSN